MNRLLITAWQEDNGVLSFEWTLLITLTVIGVIGGIAAARDAVTDELGDVAEAMLALDGTYSVAMPLQLSISINGGPAEVVGQASDSGFIDFLSFQDCARVANEVGSP